MFITQKEFCLDFIIMSGISDNIGSFLMNDVARHYDVLIDEGQDPVHDPEPLKKYMDKWDGQRFIDKLHLDKSKSVLEIGVGTGRIAVKVAPFCGRFTGIDVSEKTIALAKKNIKAGFLNKTELICADFLEYDFAKNFDIIYSTLTFLHIENKQRAFNIVADILNADGIFVLSIDKNQEEYLDIGSSKLRIFPDNPEDIKSYASKSGLRLSEEFESEFAYIFVFHK